MTTNLKTPTPLRNNVPKAHRRRWIFTGIIGALAILINIPLLNAIVVSFKPTGEIGKNPLGLPTNPTLDHYANVLYASGYDFPRFFANSAMIAVGTVLLVLCIANTFLNLPLGIILLAAGLRDIPVEIEEAAAVDGASIYRTLFSLVLPLLAPTVVAVAVLVFIFTWNDFKKQD